jgi:hypothetical protein
MKKSAYFIALLTFTIAACTDQVSETVTYKVNEPIFLSPTTFRNSVKVSTEPIPITKIGKMCFYNNFLYISEPDKGIHIIDNRDPSHPQLTGFIQLMGNNDIAIRDGKLYADSYIDLVWFDISNPQLPQLQGRLDSIFPTALPPIGNFYSIDYQKCYGKPDQGIIVGWKTVEKTEDVKNYTGGRLGGNGGIVYQDFATSFTSMNSGSNTGINGSMSRFTIYNNRLYSIINNYMNIFDLTGDKPVKVGDNMYIGWNIETIFSYKTNLFFGTSTGMLIYSVSDPLKPEYASCISHAYACDPVVVDNDLAYITIHSGSACDYSAKENALIIVDVKNVKNPNQLVTYNLTNPQGLGIDNGKLFLCDDGLKVFKISDPQTLMSNQLAHFSGMNGYDVIPSNGTLMMIASDGLYQYSYSDSNGISFLSKIPIGK